MSFQYTDWFKTNVIHSVGNMPNRWSMVCVHGQALERDESTGTVCHCPCHDSVFHLEDYDVYRLAQESLSMKAAQKHPRRRRMKTHA